MTSDDSLRIGDSERMDLMRQLDAHVADGRLTVTEYEERSAKVLEAKTRGDVREIMRDLPPAAEPGTAQPPATRPSTDVDRPPRSEAEIFPPGSPGSRRNIPHAIMAISGIAWLPLAAVWSYSFIIPAVVAILLYVAHIGPKTWYPTPEQKRALERLHEEEE